MNKIEKQNHAVKFDEKGNPIALLYRTKTGEWNWKGIRNLDENEQIELAEKYTPINKSQTLSDAQYKELHEENPPEDF